MFPSVDSPNKEEQYEEEHNGDFRNHNSNGTYGLR